MFDEDLHQQEVLESFYDSVEYTFSADLETLADFREAVEKLAKEFKVKVD